MKNNNNTCDLAISGLGITSAVGQGQKAFLNGLLQAENHFDVMARKGRQSRISRPDDSGANGSMSPFLGAELKELVLPTELAPGLLRTASFTGKAALATLHQAWNDAQLQDVAPERIGLIVGGSNLQQREISETHNDYQNRVQFLRPTYGISFMDSDICGLCTDAFAIRGFAYTLGGASASGQLSVIQAIHAVRSGQVDVCIALGALMDISYWECHGFRALGAMGSERYGRSPGLACRPFDQNHDGFIFGEACGALVIERNDSSRQLPNHYATVSGWATAMDGNRNPDPSFDGEVRVMTEALEVAQLTSGDIDYVNPHGTGSIIGDEIELKALAQCKLRHAYINATKSITGHGLSAAGTVELIATLLQMQRGELHPTRNLEKPIDPHFNWVKSETVQHKIGCALSLSFGFGGMNTALCLQRNT